ncbi:MAG: DUF393 domain-containing protein [Bdellovibrionaceae bacterium]|nr:DUF393 domain-containing protein [Pseudobdellovibrionaceae bacterium]
MKTQIKLKVYYDGLCKVCSKEIHHYMKQKGAESIEFIDICSNQFDPLEQGLDPHEIHKIMHVRTQDGTIITRVGAFIEIWKQLPRYNWLAKMAEKPLIRYGLEKGYNCFVVIRPFLPRYAKGEDCKDSPYCEAKF